MKEKNYWPHAIIGVLLFGVFMVSVSITIAMKNPIQDENTYFAKKRIVDENKLSLTAFMITRFG